MNYKEFKEYSKYYFWGYFFASVVLLALFCLVTFGAYSIYIHYGKNCWFALCVFLDIFLALLFFAPFSAANDDWKSAIEKEKKRIEHERIEARCNYIAKTFPLAYAKYIDEHTKKKDFWNSKSIPPKNKDIARVSDDKWESTEKKLIEVQKQRNLLESVYAKYPFALNHCCLHGYRTEHVRVGRVTLPEDRNMNAYSQIWNKDNENDKYKALRKEQGLDECAIREIKIKDVESENTKRLNLLYRTVEQLTDDMVDSIHLHLTAHYRDKNSSNGLNDKKLESLNQDIQNELHYQECMIKFYRDIKGVKKRDFYMDAFLKHNNIRENKIEYLISHINLLDIFISDSIEDGLDSNSKEGLSKSALIANLNQCAREWYNLNSKPYYFFYYYYPKRFTDISVESENARNLIYTFKGGGQLVQRKVALMLAKKLQETFDLYDLGQMAFVCAPASSISDHFIRFVYFASSVACPYTTMIDGTNGVEITQSGEASHYSNSEKDYAYIVKPEVLNGKIVLLFDDIVTRGNTMLQCRNRIEAAGATVVCQMSLGHTYSDYHGRPRRPHPWSGVL